MDVELLEARSDISFDEQGLRTTLEQILSKARVPGASVAIAGPDTITTLVIGVHSVKGEISLTKDTGFKISCMGKMLVALATLQLAEKGDINLDAEVGEYLPDLCFKAETETVRIRIRDLLSHTSGYRGLGRVDFGVRQMPWDDCLEFFKETPQLFLPGRVFNEENLDYVILGKVIAKATGQDVFEILHEKILSPLGIMTDDASGDQRMSTPPAVGHTYSTESQSVEVLNGRIMDDVWAPAISNLTMSPTQLAKIGQAMIGSTEQVFSEAVKKYFRSPVVSLPEAVGSKTPHWKIAGFGMGCATFANGHFGCFGTGMGQSCALVMLENAPCCIAISFNMESAILRSVILDHVIEAMQSTFKTKAFFEPSRHMTFECLLHGFSPKQLVGRYVGNASQEIGVEAGPNRLKITFGANRKTVLGALQNDRLMIEPDLRVPIAIFPDPSGRPALMIGNRAYKKIR